MELCSSSSQGRGGMQIGDLVRFKCGLNYSPENKNLLGIIMDKRIKGDKDDGAYSDFRVTEYQVSIITNNKTAWYIDGSLELVSESGRLGEA